MGWLYHARKNCGLLTVIVLGVKVIRGAAVMVSVTNVVVARTTRSRIAGHVHERFPGSLTEEERPT